MKKVIYFLLIAVVALGLISCAEQTKVAKKGALPESVMMQSRKDVKETEAWKKFDKSGPVKFLQVEHTAPASEEGTGETLDGSYGERIIEVKIAPEIKEKQVVWTLKNAGPSIVWILAANQSNSAMPIVLEPENSIELATEAVKGYTYLVVDNEGGKETTLSLKATCGETSAKTTRGKDMKVVWF